MYQQPQQQALMGGVNLQPLQPNMLIQGLPWRVPFTPNVNVNQFQANYVRDMTGHLLHEIQTRANDNQARLLLYWTVQQNNFQNQLFFTMLTSALDLTELMAAMNNNQHAIGDVVMKAAADVCKIMAVTLGRNHPSILAALSPEGRQDAEQTLAYAVQIEQQIAMYKSNQQRNNPGIGMAGAGGGGGYPQQHQQNYYRQPMMGGDMAVHRGPGFVGNSYTGGGFPANNVMPATQANSMTNNPMFANSNNDKPCNDSGRPMLPGFVIDDTPKQPVITSASGIIMNTSNTVPAHMLMGVIPPTPVTPVKENNMNGGSQSALPMYTGDVLTNPPKGEFVWNERKYIHASFATFRPSLSNNLPYGTLYDPTKVAVFYDITDPVKIKEIAISLKVLGGMQPYEEHETYHILNQNKLRKSKEPDREKARQAFLEIVKLQDINVLLDERDEKQAGGADVLEPFNIFSPFLIEDINLLGETGRPYQKMVDDYAEKHNLIISPDVVIGFHACTNEAWLLRGIAAIVAVELKFSKTWDILRTRLLKLENHIHPTYWTRVHDSITAGVNELSKKIMGLDVSITSFVDDIDELKDFIRTNHGDNIADQFERQANPIAMRWALFLETGDSLANPEGTMEVAFSVSEDIYILPCSAEDINWCHTGEAAAVLEKRMPETYQTLVKHFQRQDEDDHSISIRHTKFITQDGKATIYAVRGIYYPNTYLLYADR